MRGEEAAALFYDEARFTRVNAAPRRLKKTLFGEGAVQGLDGQAHRQRKALFLSLMSQPRIDALMQWVEHYWQSQLSRWQPQTSITLLDEFHQLLCRAACAWCGIPLHQAEVPDMTKKLVLMVEGGAAMGPKHWASRRARRQTENALKELVSQYRQGRHDIDPSLPLAKFADFQEANGEVLSSHTVAVELINVIRPIVAVARYMVFAVMAMHEYPPCLEKLKSPEAGRYRQHFIQEVRRYYPFFPFLAARITTDFTWQGYRFKRGWQAILDLYGTNHDAQRWTSPEQFYPERFEEEPQAFHRFAMIPQGGSEHATQHRCPGEWITVALINWAIEKFAQQVRYDLPPQDLTVDLNVVPARPRSGLIVTNVRPIDPLPVTTEEND
jgi:fatty-acid peroxygenase